MTLGSQATHHHGLREMSQLWKPQLETFILCWWHLPCLPRPEPGALSLPTCILPLQLTSGFCSQCKHFVGKFSLHPDFPEEPPATKRSQEAPSKTCMCTLLIYISSQKGERKGKSGLWVSKAKKVQEPEKN